MSVEGTYRPTDFGLLHCISESALKEACQRDAALAFDVMLAKENVASGSMTQHEALMSVVDSGRISMATKRDLQNCLGAISAGTCLKYAVAAFTSRKQHVEIN